MPSTALTAPEHAELPAEVREAFSDADRKCRLFIFPQLAELGEGSAVAQLVAQGQELATAAAEGRHEGLAESYRELLQTAQAALRDARAKQSAAAPAAPASAPTHRHSRESRLSTASASAKAMLPAPRYASLQRRLAELEPEDHEGRLAVVEGAVTDFERVSSSRQTREAGRLADTAHVPLRPRQRETARSRKARRDQALIVEMARSFDPNQEAVTEEAG